MAILASDASPAVPPEFHRASHRIAKLHRQIPKMTLRQIEALCAKLPQFRERWNAVEVETIESAIAERVQELHPDVIVPHEQDRRGMGMKRERVKEKITTLLATPLSNAQEAVPLEVGLVISKIQSLEPADLLAVVHRVEANKNGGNALWDHPAVQSALRERFIDIAKIILDHRSPYIDKVPVRQFAEALLENLPTIERNRSGVEELFCNIAKEKATPEIIDELRTLTGPAAINKEPDVIVNGVVHVLSKCGIAFSDLEDTTQTTLRNAAVGTSGVAIGFLGLRPWVRDIYSLEHGGPGGKPRDPFRYKPSESERNSLKENFKQITKLTLDETVRKLIELCALDPTLKDREITKRVDSICRQLGQERWWWTRFIDEQDIHTPYQDLLRTLDPRLISLMQQKMVQRDVDKGAPEHRAIYNAIFGQYPKIHGQIGLPNPPNPLLN